MFTLNYRDARPIYGQIKDSLRRMILTGVLAPNEKLPSVRCLATELAINPNTIQRAYGELEAEGFLYSVPGRGSFAALREDALTLRRQELISALDALVRDLLCLGMNREEIAALILEEGQGISSQTVCEGGRA